MARKSSVPPSADLRRKCAALVIETARTYQIPPVTITAHTRSTVADRARKEVMAIMVAEFGMPRCQVAMAFGRDLRRVRASVLGA